MRVRGIIFDCDGVLIDSEVIFLDSLHEFLNTIGVDSDMNQLKRIIGSPMNQIIAGLRVMFPLENYSDSQLIEGEHRIFQSKFSEKELKPMNGLLEFLSECKKRSIYTSIASSSDYPYIVNIVKRLNIEEMFEHIISGDKFVKGKPAPDIYEYAVKTAGIDKQHLIVIEDSENGIKSAKAAGLFTYGYKGSAITQNTSEADKEIYCFSEITI